MTQPTLFEPFQEAPPAQRHSVTSVAAAEAIKPTAAILRQRVYDHITASGGCTDNEGIIATGIAGSTWRPRRTELVADGSVRDSGKTRKTESGRSAVVWEVAK